MSQTVFIAGGTGYIGRRLVPALLARGHRVRALVRPGSEARVPGGCEMVVGTPFDQATFAAAIAPADTFVQLVGVPHPSPSKARQFIDIDLRSAVASIDAARVAAVSHFVYVSVAQPSPVMKAYKGRGARRSARSRRRAFGARLFGRGTCSVPDTDGRMRSCRCIGCSNSSRRLARPRGVWGWSRWSRS